jgi:hypothetical protein
MVPTEQSGHLGGHSAAHFRDESIRELNVVGQFDSYHCGQRSIGSLFACLHCDLYLS